MKQTIVVIGGGVAAVNAIKAIREIDTEVNIYMIMKEEIYPYYRTRLTKSLFDDLNADKILLQKKEWYEQKHINIYSGIGAEAVDPDNCTVRLEDGSSINYDKLLLANGATNNKPPIEGIDKENVHTIRTYSDIQTIKTKAEGIETVFFIGGGIQNLEAAWAFCSNGKKVIIAEFMDRLMPRQLDIRSSEILRTAVEASDVEVLLSTEAAAIKGDSRVRSIITKNRNSSLSDITAEHGTSSGDTIACDMVIYSVGIRPNISLYKNTALKTNVGVLVDEHMQTNIHNIFAAGDIAEFNGRVGGLWPVAIEQGKTAGCYIAGKSECYSGILPVTIMNAFGLSIFSIGSIDESVSSLTIIDDSSDNRTYRRLFLKDSIIIGAIIIGDTKYNNLLKKLVGSKTNISHLDYSCMTVNDILEQMSKE